MEWNKGRPGPWGPKVDRAKDGWHHTPPGGQRGRQIDPGQMIKTVAEVSFWVGVGAVVIRVIQIAAQTCLEGACY